MPPVARDLGPVDRDLTRLSAPFLDRRRTWFTTDSEITTNRDGDVEEVFVTTQLRIGIGHDTHRLAEPGPLLLGGVEIPFDKHLVGHSDADVLLHAVTDALLGAAALGDIGELFPDTAEANRDRCSAEMLDLACRKIAAAGYQIDNLDCIVFAERPKLSQYKPALQQRIAQILGLALDQVNVKAKTGEGVGAIGTEQAISAQCIALVHRDAPNCDATGPAGTAGGDSGDSSST